MQNIYTISNNLGNVAKELTDAQIKTDKLTKKGEKANSAKMNLASTKLESAQQQWDSQAPFVYESLQALDESRVNQVRDVLTQYQTHESDHAEQLQKVAAETLAIMLDIRTETEIEEFAKSITADKPPVALTRTSTRRSSVAGQQPANVPPPPMPSTTTGLSATTIDEPNTPSKKATAPVEPEDSFAEDSPATTEGKSGSKLRRLGTLFGGRRRQSVHGGFGQLSPPKNGPQFGRLGSSGKGVSPRASVGNLQDSGRLTSLAEDPDSPPPVRPKTSNDKPSQSNGLGSDPSKLPEIATLSTTKSNGLDSLSEVAPPAGPPPSQKDADGFVVRSPMNDPISEAQREAAGEETEQPYKVNIKDQPVAEEDPEEKQAALSSVANTLKMGPATQRSGTVRGRRDVRNTIYKPAPVADSKFGSTLSSIPMSDSFNSSVGNAPPSAAGVNSEHSVVGISDNQSIRSGTSLGGFAHAQHPDMAGLGLNSSIIETISANFDDGIVKNAVVNGEIAFVYNGAEASDSKSKSSVRFLNRTTQLTCISAHETIKINNFSSLEKIGPNRIFVQNSSPDQHDQFSLDLSHLDKTATAFSYRIFAEETDPPSLAAYAPLVIKPAWKPQGDKLGLLLQYQLNPGCKIAEPVSLHNVVIIATYEGKASSVQTKPSGTHLKDKHLVYWRLGDLTLTSEVQKIVCRIVGPDGTAPTPGRVEARWEYSGSGDQTASLSGISVSRLDAKGKGKEVEKDPFSDADSPSQSWTPVALTTKLVSGKYEGR